MAKKNSAIDSRRVTGAPSEEDLFGEELRYLRCANSLVFKQGTALVEVLQRMREASAGGVLIVDKNDKTRLAGIFTARDILDKIAGQNVQEKTIDEYMTTETRVLTVENTVGDAIRLMTEGGYRHVPLVDLEGEINGMVSVRDIVEYIAEHFPEEVYNLPPNFDQRAQTPEGG